MRKLNLDALQNKAELRASDDLLKSISGGLESGCHVIATVPSQGGDLIIYTK
jgi:hypothetical protein